MFDSSPTGDMLHSRAREPANHLNWVDRAKGIGIILVVFGHVCDGVYRAGIPFPPQIFKLLYAAIYSFHMPLFFLLSGLFFYDSWDRRGTGMLLRSKVDTIVYPYVLWSLLQGSVEVAAAQYTTHHASLASVLALLWHPRQQFWFLYVLFFVFVLACAVAATIPRKWQGAMVLIAAIAFVLRSDVPKVGPFYYLAADGVFFFLGMTFRDWLRRPREKVGMALLLGSVGFIAAQLALAAYRGTLGQVPQGVLDLAVALVSIGFVIALSRAWKPGWLLVLGQQSMAIYLLHTFFASGGRIVLARFLGVERLDVHLIAGTALGILLPLVCARFVEKRHIEGIFSIPARWRLAARRGPKPEFAS